MNPNFEQNLGQGSEVVLPTTPAPTERGSRKLLMMLASKMNRILFPPIPGSADPKNFEKITGLLLLGEALGMAAGALSITLIEEIVPIPWISLAGITMIMIGAGVGASAGYRLGCRIS